MTSLKSSGDDVEPLRRRSVYRREYYDMGRRRNGMRGCTVGLPGRHDGLEARSPHRRMEHGNGDMILAIEHTIRHEQQGGTFHDVYFRFH